MTHFRTFLRITHRALAFRPAPTSYVRISGRIQTGARP